MSGVAALSTQKMNATSALERRNQLKNEIVLAGKLIEIIEKLIEVEKVDTLKTNY